MLCNFSYTAVALCVGAFPALRYPCYARGVKSMSLRKSTFPTKRASLRFYVFLAAVRSALLTDTCRPCGGDLRRRRSALRRRRYRTCTEMSRNSDRHSRGRKTVGHSALVAARLRHALRATRPLRRLAVPCYGAPPLLTRGWISSKST